MDDDESQQLQDSIEGIDEKLNELLKQTEETQRQRRRFPWRSLMIGFMIAFLTLTSLFSIIGILDYFLVSSGGH